MALLQLTWHAWVICFDIVGSWIRNCINPAASLDRSHLRISSAWSRSNTSYQRLLLPNIWRQRQLRSNYGPDYEGGRIITLHLAYVVVSSWLVKWGCTVIHLNEAAQWSFCWNGLALLARPTGSSGVISIIVYLSHMLLFCVLFKYFV